MKRYIHSATDISTTQAKIAKKEEDIRKKKQLINKRNATIDKQMSVLEKYLNSDEIDHINNYIDYATEHGTYRMPAELETWQISRDHDAEFSRDFGFADDPIYKIRTAVESIYSANTAIKEYTATLNKYKDQLAKIQQKEREVDEIPEVLKDFMNQLIDEWDRFDTNIRDNSKVYYDELKNKMNELVPDIYSNAGTEKLLELYPRYQSWWEDRDRRLTIKFSMRDDFNDDYLKKPFKKKFGVSVDYAMSLWYMTDAQIHDDNVKEGKKVILDLVNRVTKITGPITNWQRSPTTF